MALQPLFQEGNSMAIEYWLYGNANYDSSLQEFRALMYSAELADQRDELIELSRRMISAEYRREHWTEKCWFAGHLRSGTDKFVVALAGEQNTLLDTQYQGSRGLFCMMALVFSGQDEGLYMQEEGMFESLKKVMREINENEGFCRDLRNKGARLEKIRLEEFGLKNIGFEEEALQKNCAQYRMKKTDCNEIGNFNILTSTPETNGRLWMESERRPVMLNILSRDDAEKLLLMFPESLISVIGATNELCQPKKNLSAIQKRQLTDARQRKAALQEEIAARKEQVAARQEQVDAQQEQGAPGRIGTLLVNPTNKTDDQNDEMDVYDSWDRQIYAEILDALDNKSMKKRLRAGKERWSTFFARNYELGRGEGTSNPEDFAKKMVLKALELLDLEQR